MPMYDDNITREYVQIYAIKRKKAILNPFPVSLTLTLTFQKKNYEIYTDALKNWEECNISLK